MAPATFTLHAIYRKPNKEPQVQTRPVHIYLTGTKVVKDTAGNEIISGRVEANVVDGVLNVPNLPDPRDPAYNPTGFGFTVTAAFRDNRPAAVTFGGEALDAHLTNGVLELEDVTSVDPSTFSPTATYVETTDLAPVATTGAYADLSGQPAIPSTAADVGAEPAGLSAETEAALAGTYGRQVQNIAGTGSLVLTTVGAQLDLTGATASRVITLPNGVYSCRITNRGDFDQTLIRNGAAQGVILAAGSTIDLRA